MPKKTWLTNCDGVKYCPIQGLKKSPNEKILEQCLRLKNISHYREVHFDGCSDPITKNWYRYDFYLPEQNLIIEYDGGFHAMEDVQKRDRFKDEYAKSKGIAIIRINTKEGLYGYFGIEIGRFDLREKKALEYKKEKRIIENPVSFVTRVTTPNLRSRIDELKNIMRDENSTIRANDFCIAVATAEIFAELNFSELKEAS